MKPFILFLLFLTNLHAFEFNNEEEEFAKLKAELMATDGSPGINEKDAALAVKFTKYDHGKVVEVMLPLLKEKKKGVAYLASYIILQCEDGLKPEHLKSLKEGWGRDGDWLPNAVASIGTEEAIYFLAEKFRANPQTRGQLDWALASLGEKAIPALLKQFDSANPKTEKRFFAGFRVILEEMKGKGKSAIPHLLKIAESKDANPQHRAEAAHSVGYAGVAIKPYIPRLKKLTRENPALFTDVVNDTIIASAVSEGVAILADKVDQGADKYTIREIALIGPRARQIGPRVLKWLEHPSWDHRVMAVRTLGAIQYKKAAPELIKLLENKMDWRLAYAASIALSDLKAKEAIPALKVAAKEHWFPIVRQSAAEAIKLISDPKKERKVGRFNKVSDLVCSLNVDRSDYQFPKEKLKQFGKVKKQVTETKRFELFQQTNPLLAKRFIKTRKINGEDMLWKIDIHPFQKGMILGADAGEWGF